ncbi:MAG: hypothetical protein U0354_17255 [Candidatus Sericytochromatia bacterium]
MSKIIKNLYFSFLSAMIFSLPALSYSPFLDQSYEIYNVRNRCEMCHSGTKLNPFGEDFAKYWRKDKNIEKSFIMVEDKDSDGDGFSNITEIKAMTLPGDKIDFPTKTNKVVFAPDIFRKSDTLKND